jgi:hypothetical protein
MKKALYEILAYHTLIHLVTDTAYLPTFEDFRRLIHPQLKRLELHINHVPPFLDTDSHIEEQASAERQPCRLDSLQLTDSRDTDFKSKQVIIDISNLRALEALIFFGLDERLLSLVMIASSSLEYLAIQHYYGDSALFVFPHVFPFRNPQFSVQ